MYTTSKPSCLHFIVLFVTDSVLCCSGTSQLMRQMDSMMNSMMQDPFASMMQPMHQQMMQIQPPQRHSAMMPFGAMPGFPMADPFGMPSIGQMFQSFVSKLNF